MLKLLPSGSNEFHNFKCGEIYCLTPTNYNVSCCMCGQKLLFDEFLQHFQKLHLTQEEIVKQESEIAVDELTIEENDIKSEKGRDDANEVCSEVGTNEWNVDEDEYIEFVEVRLPKLKGRTAKDFIPEHNEMEFGGFDDTMGNDDTESATESDNDDNQKNYMDHDETKFTCTLCRRDYKAKRGLLQHMRSCHKMDEAKEIISPYFKCVKCCESFQSERALRMHSKKHNSALKGLSNSNVRSKRNLSVRGFKCQVKKNTLEYNEEEIKSNELSSEQNIVDLKGFENTETYSGDEKSSADCFTDESKTDAVDSSQIKLENAKFTCTICSRFYKAKRGLLQHIRNYHKMKEAKNITNMNAKCNECGETFPYESDLRNHMAKHGGCSCDICGKSFTSYGNMKTHQKRHTGVRAFKCQHCDSSYYTKKELLSHVMRHTGVLPVICEVCGRSFRDKGKLTEHMRRHTGERPAKCKVCGKCFYSFHDLNVHSVTHSTERPFICSICLSTFQTKKALRVHKKLHSGERKHVCKLCGKAFSQGGALNTHMTRVHTIDVPTLDVDKQITSII